MVPRAHLGPIPVSRLEISTDEPQYRWLREHGTLHVPDAREREELQIGIIGGWRTLLSVPLRQQGELIGALNARRMDVRPFTAAQIKLLETFADQAVIAIENVRLFKELQERNRDLTEALEQQTATSEILRVISSSPTDLQPVLDTITESAAKLCDATEVSIFRSIGDTLQRVANSGMIPDVTQIPITRGSVNGRAFLDKQVIHIPDLAAGMEEEFPEGTQIRKQLGHRTSLVAPLLRESEAIGTISIRRMEVRPYSEKQITLLKTFADQAVIAIENVRLFQELKEALEQQTATSEILGVIASSPTDIRPYWMWSPRRRQNYVKRPTRRFAFLRVMARDWWLRSDRCRRRNSSRQVSKLPARVHD